MTVMFNRQFEIFLLLSDNLSFAKTAEELFMSQSSVSREIQALENRLGFPLFERSLKSVRLTPQGMEFKRTILPLMNSMQTEISRIKNKNFHYTQKLRMGFFHIASLREIPQAISIFHERFYSVLPEIHQANLNHLNAMFHSGQLDLIFAVRNIMKPKATDMVKTIYTGKFCATLPVTNSLSTQTSLTMQDLNGYDILSLNGNSTSSSFKAFFDDVTACCPDSHFIRCSTTDEQEVYLRAGIGIALSTAYSFLPDPAFVQIPIHSKYIDTLQSDYAVMWHQDSGDNHVEDFIHILEDLFSCPS